MQDLQQQGHALDRGSADQTPEYIPIIRPRLEGYLYDRLMEDMMVMMYRHDSPLAPSIADLDAKALLESSSAPGPSDIRKAFLVPMEELPTRPKSSMGFTSNLLTRESSRRGLRNVSGPRWRRIPKNPIDYTTVKKKEFSNYFKEKNQALIEEQRIFEKHFSPLPQHLPIVRKVTLRIWEEKAVDNKSLLIGAIYALQSISSVPAYPLFATSGDNTKKIRAGMPLGACVDLTGPLAYEFLDKLIQIVLPRLREWNGVEVQVPKPFVATVRQGTVTIKLPEVALGAFPDIEPVFDMFPRMFAVDVVIQTTAGNPRDAAMLLSGFQMPIEIVEVDKTERKQESATLDKWAKFKKKEKVSKSTKKKTSIKKK